jgi:hypothetical protein
MPSPTGTNYAGRFLPASFLVNGSTMAMDSAIRNDRRRENRHGRATTACEFRRARAAASFEAKFPRTIVFARERSRLLRWADGGRGVATASIRNEGVWGSNPLAAPFQHNLVLCFNSL